MRPLPTLRRKIFQSFSIIVFLYAILGAFLVISVFIASSTTPKLLHVNYDSIASADKMREAWNALDRPSRFSNHPPSYWIQQFEKALVFEEGNITEPGEKELTQKLRGLWEKSKREITSQNINPLLEYQAMNELLTNLVRVNEHGMFKLTGQNSTRSHTVLIVAMIYFVSTLVIALFISDGLATRLSNPLKLITEALQRKPAIGMRLKLIDPDCLEIFILSSQLKHLWEEVVNSQRINVKEIIQEKQKLETVLESVEDGLLVVDNNGVVTHCNSYLLSLIHLNERLVKHAYWNDLSTTSENYLKLRATLQRDISSSLEIDLQHKSTVSHFSVRSRKIAGPRGDVIGTLFLLHDISEKKQRDKFRTEFIDLLSHEIKTPLQSLGTASEFMVAHQEMLPEIMIPFVETISEDIERIRAVSNEFIQITQSHSKLMKLKLELVSMNQCIQEWIRPFKILAKDQQVSLELRQVGSEVIWAKLDPVKFPWVISNLLSNAIRFSPKGSIVDIVLTDRNGFVEIQVKDQGPGISEEDQKRMFEPFYQSSMKTPSGRTGLFGIGLTIAKEVVEAHDGKIEYYPIQPHGSEFRILLPFPPV